MEKKATLSRLSILIKPGLKFLNRYTPLHANHLTDVNATRQREEVYQRLSDALSS